MLGPKDPPGDGISHLSRTWEPKICVKRISQVLCMENWNYSLQVPRVRLKRFVLNRLDLKLGNDSYEEIQFLEPNTGKNLFTDRQLRVL